MLVHFVEPKWNSDYADWDYEQYSILSAKKIKAIDRFVKFIKNMKGQDIVVGDETYSLEYYALKIDKDYEVEPILLVYVVQLY